MRRLIGVFTWGMVFCAYAGPALACGLTPPRNFNLQSIAPADGADAVLRNAAIQLRFAEAPKGIRENSELTVRVVRVETGATVAGTLASARVDGLVNLWTPAALLDANAQYRIEVSTTESGRPESTLVSSTVFTTSDQSAGELRLSGPLRVTLRAGTATRCAANTPISSCGSVCVPDGERPALFADAELPRVSGGFDAYGYFGTLMVNSEAVFERMSGDGSADVTPLQSITIQPDMANNLTWELRRMQQPYSACFDFKVSDPSGHLAAADTFCIDASELAAAFAVLEPPSDSPSKEAMDAEATQDELAAEDVSEDDDPMPSEESSSEAQRVAAGCAVTPGGAFRHPYLSALALLVSLAVLGRRRKRRG